MMSHPNVLAKLKWATVQAMSANETEIYIYGDIGEDWWAPEESNTATRMVELLEGIKGDYLTVRINSFGGQLVDALAIFNALRRHPAAVTVEVDGVAMSAASLIAMAGDTVRMAENAVLMIHAPLTGVYGNAEEMRRVAEMLDKYAEAMSSAYARNGISQDDALALLKDGEDHYYTAAEALAAGFIDEISDALPIAASKRLDLSRFTNLPAAAAAFNRQENTMSKPDQNPAAAQQTAGDTTNVADIQAAAEKKERERILARNNDIQSAYSRHMTHDGVADLYAKQISNPETTLQDAQAALLAHLGAQAEPHGGATGVTLVADERDKFRAAGAGILLARAGVKDENGKRIMSNDNPLRSKTLYGLAEQCAMKAGADVSRMNKMDVVAAAFTQSGSDFPVLLEDAMHKALLSGYRLAPDTWSRFCDIGSVSDFRAHGRYLTGSLGNLDSLNELGEFENKTIPDGRKESVSIGTKGNLINLSRQAIINDDLGAFIGLAQMLGRAGRRTIEATVYSTLALNSGLGPLLSDGKTLFHADHGNIGTGAALSVASIDADRVLMARQTDVSGNDYLDLRPSILLLPIGLGGQAREINAQEYNDDATKNQRKPNSVRGLYDDIVDTPRLTGTARYSFADPNEAPVLEVSFLDGEQEPFLDMEEGFSVDGARYKARLDFGVSGVGYEGAVRNAGA